MGMCPRQIDKLTQWEFVACLDGFARSNGWKPANGGGPAMSIERLRELGIE